MYFIYSLLLSLGFLILLPRFLFDAFRHGKYVAGFSERLGSVSPLQNNSGPVVWIHCVSVGETQAARPLVQGIRKQYPNHRIAISTITLTGQNLAREVFKQDAVKIFYFPFDWRWVVRKTLKAINPECVLIMETELWPGFLHECKRKQIPVALVSGRLSEQSFRRYRMIKGFMTKVLSSLNLAMMQTEADAERLRALGMDADRTIVSGSLKFDAGLPPVNDSLDANFRERFRLNDDSLLILAASTHAPEERITLEAFKEVISKSEPGPRLMIAPRHPERFADVANLIESSGLRWARRGAPAAPTDANAEVILLDSIGELQSVYSLAAIVFVGGSIAKTGGHNILEPAAVGAPVIIGPHTHNFQLIVETFAKAGAIIQLPQMTDSAAPAALADVILQLLADSSKRNELATHAQRLVEENRGATERTLRALRPLLSSPANNLEPVEPVSANRVPIV
jgi:3-deoxy-D-manno-octulosonic-acid transferase